MSDIEVLEAVLSDEEFNKLESLLESGDEAALDAHLSKLMKLSDLRRAAARMREQLWCDVILNVHHYMHRKDPDKAMGILCVAATLAGGEELPPPDVMAAFTNVLNVANLEREKFSCEGST
jgi:hypothetical protein